MENDFLQDKNPIRYVAHKIFQGTNFGTVYRNISNKEQYRFSRQLLSNRFTFAIRVKIYLKDSFKNLEKMDAFSLQMLGHAYIELTKEGIDSESEIKSIAKALLNRDYEKAIAIWNDYRLLPRTASHTDRGTAKSVE